MYYVQTLSAYYLVVKDFFHHWRREFLYMKRRGNQTNIQGIVCPVFPCTMPFEKLSDSREQESQTLLELNTATLATILTLGSHVVWSTKIVRKGTPMRPFAEELDEKRSDIVNFSKKKKSP